MAQRNARALNRALYRTEKYSRPAPARFRPSRWKPAFRRQPASTRILGPPRWCAEKALTSPGRANPDHWSLTLLSSSRQGFESGPQHTTRCSPSAVKPRMTLTGGGHAWAREGGGSDGGGRRDWRRCWFRLGQRVRNNRGSSANHKGGSRSKHMNRGSRTLQFRSAHTGIALSPIVPLTHGYRVGHGVDEPRRDFGQSMRGRQATLPAQSLPVGECAAAAEPRHDGKGGGGNANVSQTSPR